MNHIISRRDLLHVGGLGLMGLSLPQLLRADQRRSEPIADSCVLFVLHGGPSQLDVWDMKPAAPPEIRGEFQPTATNVPGIQIVEHLPKLARMAHRYTIVRSMTHSSLFHNSATYQLVTGQPPGRDLIQFTPTDNDFPHLGAQIQARKPVVKNVPTAICLPDPLTDGPFITPGQNAGFLGATYSPFRIVGDPNADNFSVEGLHADAEMQAPPGTIGVHC